MSLPDWELAALFPAQGDWSEAEYLTLDTNRLVEFVDGHLEVLASSTEQHQNVLLILLKSLMAFVRPRGLGKAIMSPFPVRLRPGLFREPDVLFLRTENFSKRGNAFLTGSDLVIEVVSEDDPARDYSKKRQDYAEAGIAEYWIVDPEAKEILVLRLSGDQYDTHGVFKPGQDATSRMLEGFSISVRDVFEAGEAE